MRLLIKVILKFTVNIYKLFSNLLGTNKEKSIKDDENVSMTFGKSTTSIAESPVSTSPVSTSPETEHSLSESFYFVPIKPE